VVHFSVSASVFFMVIHEYMAYLGLSRDSRRSHLPEEGSANPSLQKPPKRLFECAASPAGGSASLSIAETVV